MIRHLLRDMGKARAEAGPAVTAHATPHQPVAACQSHAREAARGGEGRSEQSVSSPVRLGWHVERDHLTVVSGRMMNTG